MAAKSRKAGIFFGEYDGKRGVFALTPEAAIEALKKSFRFGDPAECEYALGNTWAQTEDEVGWRIREEVLDVYDIVVELSLTGGRGHVLWTCPFCKRSLSDDCYEGASFPMLFRCGCGGKEKYLIGNLA
ncbi:hypothetical protein [Blastopirellula marina]|uniref:Uncharacterized protein n=1 Tax=Blastopirellula marina TaxID=124 RepID=A0A2S8GE15_9BACT|nr:hypothetical protein [Blastopirellula marina]PQO42334.1 hypothetical protein C5Y93_28780 [Blastopirellula marina]